MAGYVDNPSYYLDAIAERVTRDIKADLKAKIMAVIEPEIDASVDAAVRELQPAIVAHRDMMGLRGMIEVVVSKREVAA